MLLLDHRGVSQQHGGQTKMQQSQIRELLFKASFKGKHNFSSLLNTAETSLLYELFVFVVRNDFIEIIAAGRDAVLLCYFPQTHNNCPLVLPITLQ